MDKIFLRELRIETIIGFWEWERRIKQVVSIDLEIGTDARVAAASDAIAGTLNYEQLAKRLDRVRRRVAVSDGRSARDGDRQDRHPRIQRAVGQGVGRKARCDSCCPRGRHRHRAQRGRLCLRFSSGPAATPIPCAPCAERWPSSSADSARFVARGCIAAQPSARPAADYLNLVTSFHADLDVDSVQEALREVETSAGRTRVDPAVCALDLDLLLYGARVDASRRLPRPGLFATPFVLGPLAALAPELVHPVTGERCHAAWQRAERAELHDVGTLRSLG